MVFHALRSRIVVPMGQEESKKATEKGRKRTKLIISKQILYLT